MNDNVSVSFPVLTSSREVQEMAIPTNSEQTAQSIPPGMGNKGTDYVAHLLRLGQLLCTLTERHTEFLCQEIKVITQERAYLHLSNQASLSPDTFSILLLQFNDFKYGYLYIARDEADQQQPAIPLFTAYMMAQAISYILHMLEQHLFLQSFCKKFHRYATVSLTKREQDVLSLMCKGYTQEEIADVLLISFKTVSTHRQRIYEQLNVHNEHDARIAAYHLGLISFLTLDG